MNGSAWMARLLSRIPQSKQFASKTTKNKVLKDIDKARLKSVRQFYASYGPKYYSRNYSLYNFLTIKEMGETAFMLKMDDSKLNGHRVSPSYIYQWVFKKGFHGGAIDGKPDEANNPHPSPGTPYWRTPDVSVSPQSAYHYWGSPAPQSESIYQMFNKYIDELQPQWGEYWADRFQKHFLSGIRKSVTVTIDF